MYFSGNYIVSGGLEKVLVKWTMGHLASKAQEKQFIPRLPGFVRFISSNNTHIAVTLSNNCKYQNTITLTKLLYH